MTAFDDTICAPATVPGAGAITIIRVSGPDTLQIIDKVVHFRSGTASESKGYILKYGTAGDNLDEVVVGIFRSPHSYTGEDSAEVSCHASVYIVQELLRLLVEAGARMAEPGEFSRRAFVNGKMDLAQAEAVADLIASGSREAHRLAMNQLKGEYSAELRLIRDGLLELTALLELELDFSEEDVEFADRTQLSSLLDDALDHIVRLSDSFKAGNAIKNGVPVAIVGDVNSGKSTLLNALVGEERAIVSDIAGTTRDTVEETVTIDGILYRFIDTAGIRESKDEIERIGISRALAQLEKADVVIELTDASTASASVPDSVRTIVEQRISPRQTCIRVSNKTDLAPAVEGTLGISAKTGRGLEELKRAISASQAGRLSDCGTVVTNLRHYEALVRASDSLQAVRSGLGSSLPSDLVAEDLRSAVRELNSIFGDRDAIDFKSVTDLVFSRFCIGK